MANLSNINGKFVVEQTTGYVGVGTTDPSYPIEVLNASAEIALNASGGSIYRLRSDSTDSFRINKNGVGDRLVIDGSGNSTFGGNVTTNGDIIIDNSSGDPFLKLKTAAQEYVIRIDQSDSEKFQIRNVTSGVNALSIDTSSNAIFAGNVGIKDNPSYSLDVNIESSRARFKAATGDANIELSCIAGSDWLIRSRQNGDFAIYDEDATSNRLTIDSAGNSTFAGSVRVTNATQSNYWLYNATKTNGFLLGRSLASNDGQDFFIYDTIANSARLTIDSSGNATFAGTLAAGATTLTSTNPNVLVLNPTASNYGGILFQYGGTTKGTSIYNSGGMVYGGESGNFTRLQAGGQYGLHLDPTNRNVHIGGTTDAAYKLQVQGTGYYSGQLTVDGFAGNSGISFRTGISITNVGIRAKAVGSTNRDGLELLGYNGIDFTVNNGANVAMRIVGVTGSGMSNVGIGTLSPDQKLEVVGILKSSGVSNSLMFADRNTTANTWEWYSSGNNAGLYKNHTSPGTVITINSSGNVGIGTTSPNTGKLVVEGVPYVVTNSGQAIGGIDIRSNASGANTYSGAISFGGTTSGRAAIAGVQESSDADTQGLAFFTHGSGTGTADADERMRITRGGRVLIGPNSSSYSSNDAITHLTGNSSNYVAYFHAEAIYAGAWRYCRFLSSGNNTLAGEINGTTTTSVIYGTSSDYRQKKNIKPLENGLERLSKLKPVKFDWKENDSSAEGFIAHEVQEIFPDAIYGVKDGEKPQGMDYGRITPLLVKAIQELKADNDSLKARIETLENN